MAKWFEIIKALKDQNWPDEKIVRAIDSISHLIDDNEVDTSVMSDNECMIWLAVKRNDKRGQPCRST